MADFVWLAPGTEGYGPVGQSWLRVESCDEKRQGYYVAYLHADGTPRLAIGGEMRGRVTEITQVGQVPWRKGLVP